MNAGPEIHALKLGEDEQDSFNADVFASEGDGAKRTLGGVVVDLQLAQAPLR